ncbi:hypothetical protein L7F22_048314 [Adiantum nelumboides]|nr:hypothetical protein [Adiantum nelumboides]
MVKTASPGEETTWFTPPRLLVLLCLVNLLNYVDRGVIASNGVNGTPREPTCKPLETCQGGSGIQGEFDLSNFQDGILSSVFLVGLLIASPIFAYMSKMHNSFKLMGIGLSVWTFATAMCGFSLDFWSITAARIGDVPDDGEPDEQPEVEENEEILVAEQILAHKDTKTKGVIADDYNIFKRECDACGSSIGAVFMQDGHVIAYESKVLRGSEKHMQIYEELLAVIHALETWKHYLLGADFTVQTDNQSLRYFPTQAKLSEKQFSWANFLSMFHFQFVHVADKKNLVVDAFSRPPHVAAVSIAYQHELDEMRDHYNPNEDFVEPYAVLVRGEHPDSFSLNDGFLMFRGKLCVSRLVRQKVTTESHSPPFASHRGIDLTIKALEMYFFWPLL